MMNKNRIEVDIGCAGNNAWFACCASIPWLATEGDTYLEVTSTIATIAPGLAARMSIKPPLKIIWRMCNENE